MNNYTLFIGFVVTLPVQALIFYCMKRDIQEEIEYRRAKQRSLDNLLGSNKITVEFTDEDMDFLENLIICEDCVSIEQYLRKEINKIKGE